MDQRRVTVKGGETFGCIEIEVRQHQRMLHLSSSALFCLRSFFLQMLRCPATPTSTTNVWRLVPRTYYTPVYVFLYCRASCSLISVL